eukprot:41213-Eustigmatos_ZCMA.PRE.1
MCRPQRVFRFHTRQYFASTRQYFASLWLSVSHVQKVVCQTRGWLSDAVLMGSTAGTNGWTYYLSNTSAHHRALHIAHAGEVLRVMHVLSPLQSLQDNITAPHADRDYNMQI